LGIKGNVMSDERSLLSSATQHILTTYAVSDDDASRHAREFLDFIKAKGGSLAGFDTESLVAAIDRHLGRVLVWKDHKRKAALEAASQAKANAYNGFNNASKRHKC
jgi:hypothetical protein